MRIALLFAIAACERAEPAATAPVHPTSVEDVAPPAPPVPPPKLQPPALSTVPDDAKYDGWFQSLSAHQRVAVGKLCELQRATTCAIRNATQGGPGHALYASVGQPLYAVEGYCETRGVKGCGTPLVLATQPVTYRGDGAAFAFAPGVPVVSEWPTAPWIALDRDGDGAITSGAELFGDHTVRGADDGFVALAALDANHDGRIDRDDPAFARLLLWADANGDRRSSPEELRPLAEVVTSISLAAAGELRCEAGHCEGGRSAAILVDGRAAEAIDVYVAVHR